MPYSQLLTIPGYKGINSDRLYRNTNTWRTTKRKDDWILRRSKGTKHLGIKGECTILKKVLQNAKSIFTFSLWCLSRERLVEEFGYHTRRAHQETVQYHPCEHRHGEKNQHRARIALDVML